MTPPADESVSAAVEESVRQAFATWTAAWNRQDLAGYLEAYWDSEHTRYVSGSEVIRGKAQIVQQYQKRAGGIQGNLSTHSMEVTPIGPRDAIVFAYYRLRMDDDTEHRGVFTVHVQRETREGQWKIHSDHSSAIEEKDP